MTLLRGGTLERKLLVRHINKSSFLGWMRAFEENDVWLENNFDYVPVEHIQSFTIRENKVDVYAGVFDIDLKHWVSVSGGRFADELKDRRQQIISTLQKLDISNYLKSFFSATLLIYGFTKIKTTVCKEKHTRAIFPGNNLRKYVLFWKACERKQNPENMICTTSSVPCSTF